MYVGVAFYMATTARDINVYFALKSELVSRADDLQNILHYTQGCADEMIAKAMQSPRSEWGILLDYHNTGGKKSE